MVYLQPDPAFVKLLELEVEGHRIFSPEADLFHSDCMVFSFYCIII